MHWLRKYLGRLVAEFWAQRTGRRALREIKFAKFNVATEKDPFDVRERLLRRMPPSWKMLGKLTTCQ